jgi:(p)ppGpp synthase/HD superfamily hydrolase
MAEHDDPLPRHEVGTLPTHELVVSEKNEDADGSVSIALHVLPSAMVQVEVDALLWAYQKHGDQRHGDRPYAAHLLEAYEVALDFGLSPEVRLATLLHDVVEDTSATTSDVWKLFGADAALLVEAVTGRGSNRRARVANAYEKIESVGARAALLKLADRIANVERAEPGSSHLSLYQSEQSLFAHKMARAALEDENRRANDLDTLAAMMDRLHKGLGV